VNCHDGVFVLRIDLQVLCVLLDRDTSRLRCRRCVFGGNTEVDPDLRDAAAAFVFSKLPLYPAAQKIVVKLHQFRQFPPDSEFNRFYGLSVLKFDLQWNNHVKKDFALFEPCTRAPGPYTCPSFWPDACQPTHVAVR
jgi:hypothetical protein